MSKSKRKPYLTEGYGGRHRKHDKRSANKAIRNKGKTQEVAKGKGYRKEYNSWNIVDYKFHDPANPKAKRK